MNEDSDGRHGRANPFAPRAAILIPLVLSATSILALRGDTVGIVLGLVATAFVIAVWLAYPRSAFLQRIYGPNRERALRAQRKWDRWNRHRIPRLILRASNALMGGYADQAEERRRQQIAGTTPGNTTEARDDDPG